MDRSSNEQPNKKMRESASERKKTSFENVIVIWFISDIVGSFYYRIFRSNHLNE